MRRAGFVISGAVLSGALLVLGAGAGAGCTFLISFDEVAPNDAGIVETSIPPKQTDSGPGTTPVDSGGVDGPPINVPDVCDEQFKLGQIGGCIDYQENGQVCADNSSLKFPAGYDASRDVVTCSKLPAPQGSATCIKHCRGPGGCAHNPAGIPDQCDQCAGKANGTHCGSEMAGWPGDTFKLLVTCTNDRMTARMVCPGTCQVKGGIGVASCN